MKRKKICKSKSQYILYTYIIIIKYFSFYYNIIIKKFDKLTFNYIIEFTAY